MRSLRIVLALALLLCLAPVACSGQGERSEAARGGGEGDPRSTEGAAPAGWALAIHGGAGTISRDLPEERRRQYYDGLERALTAGKEVLAAGGTAVDAVQSVILVLEDDPLFNAARGAVYTHEGTHELDAAIMDGRDRSCGSVTGIKTVKNPILLARAVMERTPHVFMMGEGAEALAGKLELERVENSYFDTERRREQLERTIERERETGSWHEDFGTAEGEGGSTVGAAALDVHGDLAAATSTGGLTNKRFGRVGDVPVVGAGTYADNRSCALSGTGKGEEFIKHTVARTIAALAEYEGMSCQDAADRVMAERLQPGDGGVIGVGPTGEIVWSFNSAGMFRGAADSDGRFETRIWQEE